MDATELCFTPATELARLVRAREISPVEVVETVLQRIEAINPRVRAYCTVAGDSARAAAREAEAALMRGDEVGPLHGVPVSIKDLTLTAGIRTTFGSTLYADNIPKEDALVVARLKAAGAIVMGKTNTPEFGAGMNAKNALFPATLNPWDLSKSAGGSSGGSAAAVAAGLGPLAEGTDYGGSLRMPAALCGIVAFRTSTGRVPRYPNNWHYDRLAVSGPMARTVADTALMLSVMAGPDDRAPLSLPEPGSIFANAIHGGVKGMRVAWSRDLGIAPVDPEIVEAFEKAIPTWADLGCEVEEAHPDLSDAHEIIPPLRALRTASAFQTLLEQGDRLDNKFLLDFVGRAKKMGLLEVAQAEAKLSKLWERVHAFFQRYDLLVAPTSQTASFPPDKLHPEVIDGLRITNTIDAASLTYALTLPALPVISIPCGFTAAGFPVGMQIAGRRVAEATVLRAAAAFEEAAPWAHLRPNL